MRRTFDQRGERDTAAKTDLGHAVRGLHVKKFQRKAIDPAVEPVHQATDKTAEEAARMGGMSSDQARRSHELSCGANLSNERHRAIGPATAGAGLRRALESDSWDSLPRLPSVFAP